MSQKNNLDWAHSFVEFENVLQGQYKTAWKQVLCKIFPEPDDPAMVPTEHDHSLMENFHRALELFIKTAIHKEKPRDCQYIYMMPGGDNNDKKKLVMSLIKHLHRWEEMLHVLGVLPADDIKTPGASLQVEWLYMTFHKSDHAEYMQSGQKLRDKTLQTLAEYFQSVHETHENDGSLQCHQGKKICTEVKRELHHELEELYACKLRHLTNQHRSHRLHVRCNNGYHHQCNGQREYPKLCDSGGCNNDKQDDKKGPPKHTDKDFKPCHVHVKNNQHLYEGCCANQRNHKTSSKARTNNNNKRRHVNHYQNN